MHYSENMKPIDRNYDNDGNSKDLPRSQIGELLLMSVQKKIDTAFDICQ